MKFAKFSRRRFTQLTTGLLASPFAALQSGRLHAQGTDRPFRMLTISDSYGIHYQARQRTWIARENGDYRLTDDNLGNALKPLSRHKENLLIPSGVQRESYFGGSHSRGSGSCMTGSGGSSVSVERATADYLSSAAYNLPRDRPFPSQSMCDYAQNNPGRPFSYTGRGQRINPIIGINAFASQILGGTAQEGGLDFRSQFDQRLLGLVQRQVNASRNALAGEENGRIILEAYRDSISDVVSQIEVLAANVCAPFEVEDNVPSGPVQEAFIQMEPHFDAIQHVFGCDLMGGLHYQMGGQSTNNHAHRFLYDPEIHNNGIRDLFSTVYHSSSHSVSDNAQIVQESVRGWQNSLVADLIDKLKVTPDVGNNGSVFDNTVIYIASALGGSVHRSADAPIIIIAGDNTNLRGGWHYDLAGDDTTHNDVLNTVAHGAGALLERMGPAQFNNGPIQRMLKS